MEWLGNLAGEAAAWAALGYLTGLVIFLAIRLVVKVGSVLLVWLLPPIVHFFLTEVVIASYFEIEGGLNLVYRLLRLPFERLARRRGKDRSNLENSSLRQLTRKPARDEVMKVSPVVEGAIEDGSAEVRKSYVAGL